jgi:hypothetical protein
MRTLTLFLTLVLLTPTTALPQAPTAVDAKAILERAVTAHGGKDQLVRARADQVKVKGTLVLENQQIPFVAETWVELPSRFKNVLELTNPKGTTRLVQIIVKDRVTVTLDGRPHKTSPAALSEMRETLHLNNAIRLIPLLAEPENYKCDYTGEVATDGRTLQGIKVSARDRRDLRLFFDKESGLLVRTEQQLEDGNGKEYRQETFYLDFRDLGGYKRPVKMAAYRDGKKVMDAELVEVKYHDKFEDAIFAP